MSYHGTLNRLTEDVQAKVLAVFEAWQEGRLTEDQFVQLAAAYVAQGNVRAVALADLSLATELSVELGVAQPAIGVAAKDNISEVRSELSGLLLTVAAGLVVERLSTFVSAQQARAAYEARQEALNGHEVVVGWERRTNPGACELCQDWAKGNRTFSLSVEMLHHKGCRCTQKPITKRWDDDDYWDN